MAGCELAFFALPPFSPSKPLPPPSSSPPPPPPAVCTRYFQTAGPGSVAQRRSPSCHACLTRERRRRGRAYINQRSCVCVCVFFPFFFFSQAIDLLQCFFVVVPRSTAVMGQPPRLEKKNPLPYETVWVSVKSQSRKTTQPRNLHREARGVFLFFFSVVFLSWKMKLYLCQSGFYLFSLFCDGHRVGAHREEGHSGPVSKFCSSEVGGGGGG